MKYRVELDVSFENEEDAISLLNLIEEAIKPIAVKPSGEELLSIVRHCRYHKCYHDENPPKQCGEYVNIDFDGEKIAHLTDAGVKIEKDQILSKIAIVKEVSK
jgi:hypothetical protein